MFYKNWSGGLEYALGKFIIQGGLNHQCSIVVKNPWCLSPAITIMWGEVEPFPNLTQAVKFLKQNIDELMWIKIKE